MAEAIELDSVDRKIIEQLLIDGRISFSAIAKQISLTDVAIKKRFERLVKRGIVSSIKAELNLKLLGYENPIYVQIRSEMSKTKDALKRLSEIDYVLELDQTLGEYNILAKIVVPDIDNAEKFIDKLCSIDGVMDTKTMVIIKEVKKSSSLPSMPLQKKI